MLDASAAGASSSAAAIVAAAAAVAERGIGAAGSGVELEEGYFAGSPERPSRAKSAPASANMESAFSTKTWWALAAGTDT